MTSPSPASSAPISAADREKAKELCAANHSSLPPGAKLAAEGRLCSLARTAIPAYEARVVELEAERLIDQRTIRSCNDRLAAAEANLARLTANPADQRYWEGRWRDEAARATALLEAAKPFVRHYDASWMHKWADDAQSSTFSRHTFGELRALVAAINAGAANEPSPCHPRAAEAASPAAGWRTVPIEPTEAQWGGLARDVIMWTRFPDPTGKALHQHLRRLGRLVPDWLLAEIPDTDRVPPKGCVAVAVYKLMVEALGAPSEEERVG